MTVVYRLLVDTQRRLKYKNTRFGIKNILIFSVFYKGH